MVTANLVQRIVLVLVLMLGCLAGLRIYDNMSSTEPFEEAYVLACEVLSSCPEDIAVFEEPGPFEHRFVFDAQDGFLEVRCRWQHIVSGRIECEPRRERASTDTPVERYPHERGRGLPGRR